MSDTYAQKLATLRAAFEIADESNAHFLQEDAFKTFVQIGIEKVCVLIHLTFNYNHAINSLIISINNMYPFCFIAMP